MTTQNKMPLGAFLAIIGVGIFCVGGLTQMTAKPTAPTTTQATPVVAKNYDRYLLAHRVMWKDHDAMERGQELIRLGVHKTNPAALLPYASCATGDEAAKVEVLTSTFSMLHPSQTRFVVLDGNHAGCEGVFDYDDTEKRETN